MNAWGHRHEPISSQCAGEFKRQNLQPNNRQRSTNPEAVFETGKLQARIGKPTDKTTTTSPGQKMYQN